MLAFAFGGCDSRKDEAKTNVPPKPAPNPTPALREETKKLEGAAALGIDSKALRRSVDKILDLKDERDSKVKEASKPLDEQ